MDRTKWANPLTVSIPAKASSSFSATGIRIAPLQEEEASIKHVFLSACACIRHRHTQVSFSRTKFGLESLFTFFCPFWIPGIGKWVSVRFLSQAWWHTTIIWALGKLRQKCVLFQYQPWLQRPYVKKHNKDKELLKWVYEIKAKSLKLNQFCGENHADTLWVWQGAFWIISGSTHYGRGQQPYLFHWTPLGFLLRTLGTCHHLLQIPGRRSQLSGETTATKH